MSLEYESSNNNFAIKFIVANCLRLRFKKLLKDLHDEALIRPASSKLLKFEVKENMKP